MHGGAHGGWCWEPTMPLLEGPALAVDLPPKSIRGGPDRHADLPELQTLTLADFADSLIADVDAAGYERVVLVGHSMGGLTISEVARRVPDRVAHLVYVSCLVPPEGGSGIEAFPPDLGNMTFDEAGFRQMFCNDMDEHETGFVLDNIGTEVAGILAEPVTRRGMSSETPKTYVKLLRDQSLPPEHQDLFIDHLRESPGGDVDVVAIDAGHDVMISRPRDLAEALNRLPT